MTTHARSRRFRETTLDPTEQSELALKLRYGIGLEQLLGSEARAAMAGRSERSRSARALRRRIEPETTLTDDQIRAKAAAVGVGPGFTARSRWLFR